LKITVLTDYFPPELNAPANRMYEFAKIWVEEGHEVTVLTSFPNSPSGKLFAPYKHPAILKIEEVDKIKVIRVWTFMAPNSGFFLRTLDHLSYAFSSILVGIFLKKSDYIIATSPQFFTVFSGYCLSLVKRCKWIFEVRDIWPQAMIVIEKESFIFKVLEWLEIFFYKRADKIVVVTNSFKKDLVKRCNLESDKISVIFNGTSENNSHSANRSNRRLSTNQIGDGTLVVGYAGTLGVSQGFEFLLTEISKLRDEPYKFVFLGDGAKADYIREMKQQLGLDKVEVLPAVDRLKARKIISTFDIGLVPLKDFEPYRKVVPSKIFNLASNKIPILLGVRGEASEIVKHYNIGESYIPENSDSFRKNLKLMKERIQSSKGFYLSGLNKAAIDFSHKDLALKYQEVWKDQ